MENKKYLVRIRYNTQNKEGENLFWRVLVDGVEHLVSNVYIGVPSYTSTDMVNGIQKFHISCVCDKIVWTANNEVHLK